MPQERSSQRLLRHGDGNVGLAGITVLPFVDFARFWSGDIDLVTGLLKPDGAIGPGRKQPTLQLGVQQNRDLPLAISLLKALLDIIRPKGAEADITQKQRRHDHQYREKHDDRPVTSKYLREILHSSTLSLM